MVMLFSIVWLQNLSKSSEKVEENHFSTRKRLLEYDDVMNIQREAIYKKRKMLLVVKDSLSIFIICLLISWMAL
ncbi:MAG: hypothetical protein R2771_01940 [Saprospiraceae bacterium]